MGGDADGDKPGDKPGLREKLAVVEMLEGEGEAPTLDVGDPAPHAPTPRAETASRAKASPDTAAMRAEGDETRRRAGEVPAAPERLEPRSRG